MNKFNITIDGILVEVTEGMTVLQAARSAGLYIPSLCAHKDLEPYGACRLCIVEIDGVRGTPTSCTTPVTPNMVVRTNTEALHSQRKATLELMMSGHPSACLVCDSREDCESTKKDPTKATASTRCGACSNRDGCTLRGIALDSYTRDIGLPILYDVNKLERDDAFIERDHNLCVLCGICFRTCEKVHGTPAIAIANRGKKAKISSAFEKMWSKEECRYCGACIDECPTGCLTDKWSKWFGEEDFVINGSCEFCHLRCGLHVRVKEGRIIGTRKKSLENKLCVNGRFCYPQIVNSKSRLGKFMVRVGEELVPSTKEESFTEICNLIKNGKIAILTNGVASSTTKKSHIQSIANAYGYFYYPEKAEDIEGELLRKIDSGEIETIINNGNYTTEAVAKKIKNLICLDFFKTPIQSYSKVIVPARVLAEKISDKIKTVGDSCFIEEFFGEIKNALGIETVPFIEEPKKTGEKFVYSHDKLPRYFYGHALVDYVPDLELLGFEPTKKTIKKNSESGYEILEKETLAPNFHKVKIKAPAIAKYAKAGQFAILMANEHSERSPFTISDWDSNEGWVEFVFEEVGRSSAELARLKEGESLFTVSGPLGSPFDFEKVKDISSAMLLGGCYGIAAIFPIARELKNRGVKVLSVIEASSSYLLFGADKLKSVSDELVIMTRDGTVGAKGGCSDVYEKRGGNFDCVVSIGCVFMMKQTAKHSKKFDKQIQLCALNPIMVDGTGMCGACRVTVDNKTKFACVDGPVFDLGLVDFDELGKRRRAYSLLEIDAMPRHSGGNCTK